MNQRDDKPFPRRLPSPDLQRIVHIRIDYNESSQEFIGTFKRLGVHNTSRMNPWATQKYEGLEYDLNVKKWDGNILEFSKT